MAAVSVHPSPQTSLNMSTRRPLANVPNATNSPHRLGLVPAKRPRTNTQIDIPYGQPPPKKQIADAAEDDRSRVSADSRLFSRRPNNGQPSAFERKLVAVRDKERQAQTRGPRHDKPSAETIDSIRQWQRHYRKAFPQFVFYFDSVSEDVRSKCSRQVTALGAREEKFFSRLVTHVVTSRQIPPENESTSPTEANTEPTEQVTVDGTLQTVNPSLLEKNADTHLHMSLKNDARREQTSMDVLHRARRMKMKIWAFEKLQRMITTINDGDIGGTGQTVRNNVAGGGYVRNRGDNDLSQVLQNELHGSSERNPHSVLKDLVMFKGPFVYVHDMDEKTRPVMVRDYPKVAKRQDGIWPQFRSAPLGKCPFIEEPPARKDTERQRPRQQEREKKPVPKAIPAPATQKPKIKAPSAPPPPEERSLCKEMDHGDGEEPVTQANEPEAQEIPPPRKVSPRKSSESFAPPPLNRTGPFYHGREPAASGVQPSNITSAIRSQMVSSTAAAPGAKAGVSKEVHELKRKVLEKGTGGLSTGTGNPISRGVDASGMLKLNRSNPWPGKFNPPERPGHIADDKNRYPAGNDSLSCRPSIKRTSSQKERRRDPKPGYCENCRDKFDDFDEHVGTRKHRKFAANPGNWHELDALLFELKRR
ncbi:protein serine/threonine kinase activating protein nimO [Aspergillus candidus]|uniref:G1/S regulator NimO n=1 Tax=Aspergillus candidus TaxID=41067 RepID=A0A2I2FG90_ASPCN|nr:G1/S regulator NimO [Aspergillus candidus]PLB39642.1 G1/S regulator NimO [Aspergillus candidus]